MKWSAVSCKFLILSVLAFLFCCVFLTIPSYAVSSHSKHQTAHKHLKPCRWHGHSHHGGALNCPKLHNKGPHCLVCDSRGGLKFQWSPDDRVERTLHQGEATTTELTLVSSCLIEGVRLEVTPSLRNFVEVQPNFIDRLFPGEPRSISLIIKVPDTTVPGFYEGTLHVRAGSKRRTVPETLKIVLEVRTKITPPPEPVPPPTTGGVINGYVFDAITKAPIVGARVSAFGQEYVATTGNDGRYFYYTTLSGTWSLTITAPGYTYAQRRGVVGKGMDSSVSPCYLIPKDTKKTIIGPGGGTHQNSTGTIIVQVPPGALSENVTFVTTDVPKARSLPGNLPHPSVFTMAHFFDVEEHPDGISFAAPVVVKAKNVLGFEPGTLIPVGAWNNDSLSWDGVGMAQVSSDKQWVVYSANHFTPYDWNLVIKRERDVNTISSQPESGIDNLDSCTFRVPASGLIGARSGDLSTSHTLPSYRSMGASRSVSLHYNHLTAYPNPIFASKWKTYTGSLPVNFGFDAVYTLSVAGQRFDYITGFSFATTESAPNWFWGGGVNARRISLPTGSYPFEAGITRYLLMEYYKSLSFAGAPTEPTGIQTREPAPLDVWWTGRVNIENRENSPFGAGWAVSGLSQLHLATDGMVSLTTGDGGHTLFSPNGGFEMSDLSGYGTEGYVQVVRQLGGIAPPEGQYMAYLSSSAQELVGSARTPVLETGTFLVPPGATTLSFKVNILTSDTLGAEGLNIWLRVANDNRSVLSYGPGAGLPAPGVDLSQDPQYPTFMTGFYTVSVDVTEFAGKPVPIALVLHARIDDTTRERPTAILLDDLHFEGATSPLYLSDYRRPGSSLLRNPDGTWLEMALNGTRSTYSQDGLLLEVRDRNGNPTTFTYDNLGRILVIRDPMGLETKFTYAGNLCQSITDPAGRTTWLTHDGTGNLTGIGNPDGSARRFVYDDSHRMTSDIDPLGKRIVYTYDLYGRISQVVEPNGGVINYSVTASQNIINDAMGSEENPQIPRPEAPSTVTDPPGNPYTYRTCGCGSLTSSADPLGRVLNIIADRRGNPVRIQFPNGNIEDRSYDDRGNLLTIERYSRPGEIPDIILSLNYEPVYNQVIQLRGPENGRRISIIYDDRGNPTMISTALGPKAFIQYTPQGQPSIITDAIGGPTIFSYNFQGNPENITDSQGNIINVQYDQAGNAIMVRDAKGQVVRSTFDAANRLISAVDQAGSETRYAFDPNGNLLSVTDANNNPTLFAYNAMDLVEQVTNPLGQVKKFEYDLTGVLTKAVDFSGKEVIFSYDQSGRLIQKETGDNITQMNYDQNGNITRIADNKSEATFRYDSADRLIGIAQPQTQYQAATEQIRTLDLSGNPIQTQTFTFTGRGMLETLTSQTYDFEDRLENQDFRNSLGGDFRAAYRYDPLSRRTERMVSHNTVPSYHSTEYQYDSLSQLTRLTDLFMGQDRKELGRVEFNYDQIGNLTTRTDQSGVHTYTYDAINRLIAAFHPDQPNEEYRYDPVGNRIGSHLSANYRYDQANRLLEDDAFTYQWDPNGNLSQKQNKTSLQVTRYTYNGEDQLSKVEVFTNPGEVTPTLTAEYVYDVFGRRITKSVNGDLRLYVYNGEDRAMTLDKDSRIIEVFTHGPGIDEPLITQQFTPIPGQDPSQWQTQTLGYSADHLGSIAQTFDWNTGDATSSLVYDSFGRRISVSGSPLETSYTGREWDEETGVYFYRARYIDPQVGRFTQEDPVGLLDGPNLYAYVGNNPINWVDPFGLLVEGYYFRQSGTLAIWDTDTGEYFSFTGAFSGGPDDPPIPGGAYEILDYPDKSYGFRLDALDNKPRNDIYEAAKRDKLRFHIPGSSIGCISSGDPKSKVAWKNWYRAKSLILRTRTEQVPDFAAFTLRSKLGLAFRPKITKYGTLHVVDDFPPLATR